MVGSLMEKRQWVLRIVVRSRGCCRASGLHDKR